MIAKVNRMHEFRCSMQGFLQNKWRQQQWVVACLVLISAGLVFSRALLSFSSVLIAVPVFFSFRKNIVRNLSAALLLIILPVVVSGFWSDNSREWWQAVLVRLPLFTIMLGCAPVTFYKRNWLTAAYAFLLSVMIGCVWSLCIYLSDTAGIQNAYLRAKVLPTLADHDYVRFSWMVAVAVLLGCKCFALTASRYMKWLLTAALLLFIIYLHILAAKTGLMCLYTCAALYLLHMMVIRRQWKTGALLLSMAVVFTVTAYFSLPTLRNRIQYIRYDFSLYSQGAPAVGYNDAARWQSVKAGFHITQSHPLSGVGFGDMRSAVVEWHQRYRPESLAYERFLPANEWMVYGTGSGWPGILIFSSGIAWLLYAVTTRRLISVLLSAIAFLPLLTDDTLEGQLGVAILAFIVFFAQREPVKEEQI